jgi:hypothetical protein
MLQSFLQKSISAAKQREVFTTRKVKSKTSSLLRSQNSIAQRTHLFLGAFQLSGCPEAIQRSNRGEAS